MVAPVKTMPIYGQYPVSQESSEPSGEQHATTTSRVRAIAVNFFSTIAVTAFVGAVITFFAMPPLLPLSLAVCITALALAMIIGPNSGRRVHVRTAPSICIFPPQVSRGWGVLTPHMVAIDRESRFATANKDRIHRSEGSAPLSYMMPSMSRSVLMRQPFSQGYPASRIPVGGSCNQFHRMGGRIAVGGHR